MNILFPAGVFLWTVDPASVSARPSASCAIHLKQPGHSPVTSVAWSPDGDLLATASASDATMYIWDPAQESSAALRRLGGGGVCLATWSPMGDRLFASTAGIVFRWVLLMEGLFNFIREGEPRKLQNFIGANLHFRV